VSAAGPASGLRVWGAGSPRSLRVYWALEELGLRYEHRPIGPRTGETQTEHFTGLNPKQKIPVLEDGDQVFTESAAIVSYLGMRYGKAGDALQLVPTDPIARARYDEWASYISMELDAHTLYVLRKHADLTALYGEAPAAVTAAREGFEKQIGFALNRLKANEFLLDDGFSGADLLLATVLGWANAYGFVLDPVLVSYRDRLRSRPAYARAARANQLS
jgi:glutathione S-transferase